MSDQIDLIYKGENYKFPIVEGTEKESAIDIKTLRAQTGLITLDPGFKNTGSCQSEITFLDGEEGYFDTVVTTLKILPITIPLSRWLIY